MHERAGDAAIRAGNCLQAYRQYVENNFQRIVKDSVVHASKSALICSRPLVKYRVRQEPLNS